MGKYIIRIIVDTTHNLIVFPDGLEVIRDQNLLNLMILTIVLVLVTT